mgnify:CR=1 FL=1
MNKAKIEIAENTLKILSKKSFRNMDIDSVLNNKNQIFIKTKKDLLININKFFDFRLRKDLTSIEISTSKDMLFEILMARFDILNNYRKPILNLIKHFQSNPKDFIIFIPTLIESIILMLTLSNINIKGIKGAAKIKGLLILYVLTIFVWRSDDTESLEKTMTSLDKYLDQFDRITKVFN